LLYADDSCIIAPSPAGLQKLLTICCDYADENSIVYNESKTKCMCLGPRTMNNLGVHVPPLFLNNVKLTFVSSNKYLGVHITQDMQDDEDLYRHTQYLYSKGNMIIRSFKKCSDEVKHYLFKTYCKNVYSGHLWTKYRANSMTKLKVAFNNIYRSFFNIKSGTSMSMLYVQNNIDPLKVILGKAAYSFRKQALEATNKYIQIITTSVYFYQHSSFTVNWCKELFTTS
jgi:hypothetical protein